jgi:gluconokinase
MNLLCFDVSTGGISAALIDSRLAAGRSARVEWTFDTDSQGAATLTAPAVIDRFNTAIRRMQIVASDRIDGICIDTFLHSCLLLDDADLPLTPVFTWLDHRGRDGVDFFRSRLPDFHDRTGCRFHPMFPVFKLAALRLARSPLLAAAKRIVSVKSLLLHESTGRWIEDHGTASASGLFNIREKKWDPEILDLLGITPGHLPAVTSRNEVAGRVRQESEFELLRGAAVINGTGDGFTASVGSACETPDRISVTLGTSGVVRQTLPGPVLDPASGTFCYMADEGQYLLGCAGSNGGNILDWGRAILGPAIDETASTDPPIFIPLLHGERSPDWNPNLTGSWHGLTARHTAADLSRSILEGVIFNLAHYIEIVQRASGRRASGLVLSGNGFRHPLAAPVLGAVSGIPVSVPEAPGLMSLRGAAVIGLRSLGRPAPELETRRISPLEDPKILGRYAEYRQFRGNLGPASQSF